MKRFEPDEDLDNLAHTCIGAAIEVHRQLGPGFLESIYEEAMCIELGYRGIPFRRQVGLAIAYKGQPVGLGKLDLVLGDRLVVELKAVDVLTSVHAAQVLSYLKALPAPLGLLLNFNVRALPDGIRRSVRTL